MRLDISAEEFQAYSAERKKRYIANLLIQESGAISVPDGLTPVAFVMAGLPGAGKTEFLDTISELLTIKGKFEPFVRIDLDQIVTVYPDYTPKDYYKFRSSGNVVLARCVDMARYGRYNMMIDGTFSGKSGATVNTIGKLLDDGYRVELVYMYDEAETAWMYTQKRELETSRGVDLKGFLEACTNIIVNLQTVKDRYFDNDKFEIIAVIQKELRDKEYAITTENDEVDNMLHKTYNTSNIKDAKS